MPDSDTGEAYPCRRCGAAWLWPDDLCPDCFYAKPAPGAGSNQGEHQ